MDFRLSKGLDALVSAIVVEQPDNNAAAPAPTAETRIKSLLFIDME
jgi:hypothetical protein